MMASGEPTTLSLEVRELLDAFPMAVVAVSGDRRLLAGNRALAELFGDPTEVIARQGGAGDLARCVNAITRSEGCGHTPACAQCMLRLSAEQAVRGARIVNREVHLKRQSAGGFADQVFLISGAPYHPAGSPVCALLFIQEITALHRLRGLVPICASCKKIRGSDEDWQRLERFIEEHSYASFTHSVCPECAVKLYPEAMGPR